MAALPSNDERISIVRGGLDRLTDLRPLWQSLHEHHAKVAPHLSDLGPVRSPARSWEVRRALYTEWLSEPDAFVLVADASSHPVGYALVHMRGPEETWASGDRVAELETLTVLPRYRNRGLGRALVNAVYHQLRTIGVRHLAVSVIASNDDAIRFYDRLGMHRFLISFIGNIPDAAS